MSSKSINTCGMLIFTEPYKRYPSPPPVSHDSTLVKVSNIKLFQGMQGRIKHVIKQMKKAPNNPEQYEKKNMSD